MIRIPTDNPQASNTISALILAGGRAQRMEGCDKGLVELQGIPMISHVITRLRPQLDLIRINANRNQATYAALGINDEPYRVISDSLEGFQGPLAGIAQGLQQCPTDWMLVVPCDTPLLPQDLVKRMRHQQQHSGAEIAVAHDGQRLQPVIALIHRELHQSLLDYLAKGERKIDRWYARHSICTVDFSDQPETFININSLQDKQSLENRVV